LSIFDAENASNAPPVIVNIETEEPAVKKKEEIKIYTHLNVGRPLPVHRKGFDKQMASGYVIAEVSARDGSSKVESTPRRDFKIRSSH